MMANTTPPGQQQREAYGALERACTALVAGDRARFSDSLDKVQGLDGRGIYADVVAALKRLAAVVEAGDDPDERSAALEEFRRVLGPHPLASIIDERWPPTSNSQTAS